MAWLLLILPQEGHMTKQLNPDGGPLCHRFVPAPRQRWACGLTRVGATRLPHPSKSERGTFLCFLLPESSLIDAMAAGEDKA